MDVREIKRDERRLNLHVSVRLLTEENVNGSFTTNLRDELAKMIGDRLESTQGVTVIESVEFEVELD